MSQFGVYPAETSIPALRLAVERLSSLIKAKVSYEGHTNSYVFGSKMASSLFPLSPASEVYAAAKNVLLLATGEMVGAWWKV